MRQEQFGPYRVVKLIGRGGMGAVYEAVDPESGQAVALKTLASHLADDAGLRRRFFAEIETLKSLVHPGIVRLLAFGEQEGMPYFAMELVRGRSVDDVLRREGPIGWQRTLEVATAVARGLKVAHDHGVVHRDLKPANILLGDDGSIKLADFGIAKLFGHASLTAHGSVVGTAEYMPPEQAAGRSTDHRVDFYSLGAAMFAMLAGHPPFRGTSMLELLEKHQHAQPPRVSAEASGVPPALDELIDRLLAKDPASRPPTALVLVRLLEAVGTVSADRISDDGVLDGRVSGDGVPDDAVLDEGVEGGGAAAAPPTGGPVVLDCGDNSVSDSRPTTPESPRREVDLLAATIGPATSVAGTRASVPAAAQPDCPGATTHVDPVRQTRFTTVEHLAQVEEERRLRAARTQALVRAIATTAMLAAVAVVIYMIRRPPTADESYARIMSVVDAGGDLRDAAASIETFLAKHGDDPRAGRVRGLAAQLEIDELERDVRRPLRRSGDKLDSLQRDYLAAMARAEESPSAGITSLRAWLALHTDHDPPPGADRDPWRGLVERQIERLAAAAEAERIDDAKRLSAALDEARSLAALAAAEADAKRAAEMVVRRTAILEAVIQLFSGRPHARDAVREATRLLEQEDPADTPQREEP